MPRKFADLSIGLENDVLSDPPGYGPKIASSNALPARRPDARSRKNAEAAEARLPLDFSVEPIRAAILGAALDLALALAWPAHCT